MPLRPAPAAAALVYPVAATPVTGTVLVTTADRGVLTEPPVT
ncbi:hypothetical protein [Kitasatospora sp. NPDC005748]